MAKTVASVLADFGRIDCLVNNAGGQFGSPLEKISAKGWDTVVRTNLTGGFLVARECYTQWMKARWRGRDRQHDRRHVERHAGHGALGRGARRHAQLHRDRGARVGADARERRRAGLDRFERARPLSRRRWRSTSARCRSACRSGAWAPSPRSRRRSCSCSRRRRPSSRAPACAWTARCRTPSASPDRIGSGKATAGIRRLSPREEAEGARVMPAIQSRIDVAGEAFQRNRAQHADADRAPARAREANARRIGRSQAPVRQARPAAAARAHRAAARCRRAVARALLHGRLLPRQSRPGEDHPRRRHDRAASATSPACAAMVVASDSGIDAGAIQHMGREKLLRAQGLALENRLPFVHLVESAGANLLKYRVEGFVHGGAIFYNLAKLSAAGLPVVTVVHGSSTAGGAYMPGLSDYVIMVRGRAKAFLAGPPLLKAATGEIATDEELGGAVMHTHVSGLGEYLAENDADGIRYAREVLARLDWKSAFTPSGKPPRYAAEELLGVIPEDYRKPVDMREAIARFVDDSDFLDFKADYGAGDRVRPRRGAGIPRRHRHQQRAARPGGREQGHALHPVLLPGRAADPLPAEHHRLHRRQGFGRGRHDQARLEDDPGGVERQRAADHADVRRLLRRGQLRHVRARLQPAVPLLLAERADRGDGRRAGRAHHGDRDGRRHEEERPGRGPPPDRRHEGEDRRELRAPAERPRDLARCCSTTASSTRATRATCSATRCRSARTATRVPCGPFNSASPGLDPDWHERLRHGKKR